MRRLAALTLAALLADAAAAQVPAPAPAAPATPVPGEPGGGPGGDRGRMRGGPPDSDMRWRMMTRGQEVDSINLNERPDIKGLMESRGTPIPANGILTKAEFKANFDKQMAERGPRGPRPGGNDTPQPAPPVQFEPQPQPFQPPGGPPQGGGRKDKADEPAQRASVSRFGHLPKGLESWFEQYDADTDGMVGLYEWRRNGRKIPEFVGLDLNGDGFLTADEWIRAKKLEIEKKPAASSGDADDSSASPAKAEGKPGDPTGRPTRGQRGGPPGSKDGKDRKKGNPFLNGGKS